MLVFGLYPDFRDFVSSVRTRLSVLCTINTILSPMKSDCFSLPKLIKQSSLFCKVYKSTPAREVKSCIEKPLVCLMVGLLEIQTGTSFYLKSWLSSSQGRCQPHSPGWTRFHFPHFSSNFDNFFLFFFKLFSFFS